MEQQAAAILESFVKRGKLREDDIPRVVAEQRRNQTSLEETLIDLGHVTERDMSELSAERLRIPFCSVEELYLEPPVVLTLPEEFSISNAVIVVEKTDCILTVVASDPQNVHVLDEIRRMTGLRLTVRMGARGEIVKKISEFRDHFKAAAVGRLLANVEDHGVALTRKMGLNVGEIGSHSEHSAAVKTVNILLLKGILKRASDIHLVPGFRAFLVKYRVDGKLVTGQVLPVAMAPSIISRIKIMARMDISERRMPQDGSFHLDLLGRQVDMRVATSPTILGEKMVLRILDKQTVLLGLENLGFSPENYLKVRRNIRRPNGIILMVGPTGSGKTTTLYSALLAINSETKNITTIEDPVEYHIDGITQIQTHHDIGLTFAHLLRSILRQDPDVILVGEIRDRETAEIAIRASLTGHLVFATLHTNDAVSAVTRLLDMGIEPYLIASALRCVVSQRLVRTICPQCKEPSERDRDLAAMLPCVSYKLERAWRGKKCAHCFHTGYRGRTAMAEVLEWGDAIRQSVIERASNQELTRVAVEQGMTRLFRDGMSKVAAGVTTMDEVLAVCEEGSRGWETPVPVPTPAPVENSDVRNEGEAEA